MSSIIAPIFGTRVYRINETTLLPHFGVRHFPHGGNGAQKASANPESANPEEDETRSAEAAAAT
jgi:hypothetical protein